jgi:hypothetical protein
VQGLHRLAAKPSAVQSLDPFFFGGCYPEDGVTHLPSTLRRNQRHGSRAIRYLQKFDGPGDCWLAEVGRLACSLLPAAGYRQWFQQNNGVSNGSIVRPHPFRSFCFDSNAVAGNLQKLR